MTNVHNVFQRVLLYDGAEMTNKNPTGANEEPIAVRTLPKYIETPNTKPKTVRFETQLNKMQNVTYIIPKFGCAVKRCKGSMFRHMIEHSQH